MWKRIFAIFRARNIEFLKDRASLSWNLILPVMLLFGLSFIFSGGDRNQYTIGVLQEADTVDESQHPFFTTRYMEFVAVTDRDDGFRKVGRHQLDMLVQFEPEQAYWVNPDSPKGYYAELALLQSDSDDNFVKRQIEGEAIRYVDWVLPGILGMNMMFSCLFGIGYVVVRYRKNGFLKRLRATPLRPLEFVIAQVASRLILILSMTTFLYVGIQFFLDVRMEGSHWLLFSILVLGSMSMISLGLLVAARVTSEELAGGLMNLATWPMMLLSGVWFSLEAASPWVKSFAAIFPLTHVLNAARAVMLDGVGLAGIASELTILAIMTVVFLAASATTFRWHPR